MITRIYKEVFFEATHRLQSYPGKCARLHGHQWRVEVWIKGTVNKDTGILLDYNCIKEIINPFDHQVILSDTDPMADAIRPFHEVITTPSEPSSEHIAWIIASLIDKYAVGHGSDARVEKIRVWESIGCYAELVP
ncbi:MAG: 6-carboxytetrahydropterin synthase [Methanospirillaceae archaeon]|nr:6-carboxytetrahydropterin synthase [Methanospirillaceae archaeon]